MTTFLTATKQGFMYECIECGQHFIDEEQIEAGHDCEVTK